MKKILVTGGMGFVGSHLSEKLAQAGYHVTVFDAQKTWDLNGKIDFIQGDLMSYEQMQSAVAGKDGVIHLAAVSKVSSAFENPLNCMRVNVLGTMHVLEAARHAPGRPWVILTSTRETSSGENTRNSGVLRKIENIYGISKQAGEICGERYAIDYHSRVMTLKLSDVYGSERDNPRKVVSRLIIRALNNLDLMIQQGEQQFDFTHVQDTTDGFLLAIKNIEQAKESYYNDFAICTGKKTSLETLARLIIKETGSSSRVVYFELNVKPSQKYFTSPKKAGLVLGFKPKIKLAAGIRETIKIIKEHMNQPSGKRFQDALV